VTREAATLDVPLVELVDRLLNRGVVLTGELTISVAGVDLIYLGLSVVLSSVDTIRRAGAEV
jgi:gas vesicle structural protein